MSDIKYPPRRDLPITPERWRDILDTALEHAAHGWHALEQEGVAKNVDPAHWPPFAAAPIGSAPYHIAALIAYVHEVYSGIKHMFPEYDDEGREMP